jgi:4-amino-4-deoxy-L-arabinose transferase-like glycosyltransferase
MKYIISLMKKPVSYKTALVIVACAAIFIRCVLFIRYNSNSYATTGDDVDYRNFALNILKKGPLLGQGERAPLYTSMLAALWFVFGDYPSIVILTQMSFGILTAIIWTQTLWRITSSGWVAALTGLSTTLFLPAVVLELRLLTEPLSLLIFAIISKYFIEYFITQKIKHIFICAFFIFLFSMIRISFVFFFIVPFILLIFNFIRVRQPKKYLSLALIILSVQCIFAILLTLTISFKTTGHIHMTTLSGRNLSGMICQDMDIAPSSDIKEIFLKYRSIHYEKYGNCEQTIGSAYPEITQKTKLPPYILDEKIKDISIFVIKQKPGTYIRSVSESMSKFLLSTPIYGENFLIKLLFIPLQYIIFLSIFISIGYVIAIYKNIEIQNKNIIFIYFQWTILSFLYMLVVHTFFAAGDNGRYRFSINILPYTVIFIVVWIYQRTKTRIPKPEEPV